MFAIQFTHDSAVAVGESSTRKTTTPSPENAAPLWLRSLLNDVGFGVLILDPELGVCFSNEDAMAALAIIGIDTHSCDGKVNGLSQSNTAKENLSKFLATARQAAKGQRKLVIFGDHNNQVALAMSPILLEGRPFEFGIMVTMERKTVCERSSLWAYGKVQGLTPGELKVLQQLANGEDPKLVAENLNISVTTVRTHIRSMVSKTESSCMRGLLMKVAKLPPMRIANS
jgi:hypothetical protein